jgi:hypothetical protein
MRKSPKPGLATPRRGEQLALELESQQFTVLQQPILGLMISPTTIAELNACGSILPQFTLKKSAYSDVR